MYERWTLYNVDVNPPYSGLILVPYKDRYQALYAIIDRITELILEYSSTQYLRGKGLIYVLEQWI